MSAKKINRKVFWVSLPIVTLMVSAFVYYLYLISYTPGIIYPLGEKIKFSEFTFDAEEGTIVHLLTGTHIQIPGNILIDNEGRSVQGRVTLKFREYHTANDIFLSGIPMQMRDDRNQFMESNGMMEMRIEKNGKPLSVKKGENIEVDLANFNTPTDGFELFYLNNDEVWDEGKPFQSLNNDRRDSSLAALPPNPSTPINPIPGETDRIFTLAIDSKKSINLKAWENVKFRFLEDIEGLEFNDAVRINWDNTTISRSDKDKNLLYFNFNCTLRDNNGNIIKHFSKILAEPLLSGKKLERAMKQYDEDLKLYEKELAKIEEERTRLENEAALLSRFTVNEFGIFNIDFVSKLDESVLVELDFDFENEINPLLNQVMLYVILEDKKGVVKLNASDWNKVPASESETSLAAVLPDGTVAFVDADSFKKKVAPESLNKSFAYKFYFKTQRIKYENFIERINSSSAPKFI